MGYAILVLLPKRLTSINRFYEVLFLLHNIVPWRSFRMSRAQT